MSGGGVWELQESEEWVLREIEGRGNRKSVERGSVGGEIRRSLSVILLY